MVAIEAIATAADLTFAAIEDPERVGLVMFIAPPWKAAAAAWHIRPRSRWDPCEPTLHVNDVTKQRACPTREPLSFQRVEKNAR